MWISYLLAQYMSNRGVKDVPVEKAESTGYIYAKDDPVIPAEGMIALIWVFTLLACMAVVGRVVYRKTANTKRLELDDYIVILAALFLIAQAALYTPSIPIFYDFLAVLDGLAESTPGLVKNVILYLKLQFASILFFWSSVWAVKFAFLVFYKKLYNRGSFQKELVAWWVVCVFCGASLFGCYVTQFVSCTPFNSYFVPGACETGRDIYVSNTSLYYSTAVDIACDLFIMALPITLIWKLQLKLSQKISVMSVFGLGFVIIAFSVLRFVKTHPNDQHVNPKWLCIFSMLENSVAVIVACAPPGVQWFRNRKQSRSAPGGGVGSGSTGRLVDSESAPPWRVLSRQEAGSGDEKPN